MIIKMTQDAKGVWRYDDPAENDMVYELEAVSGHELTSFDVLLNDVAQWAGYEKAHAHLVGLRHDLVYKFKRYFDDTEALELAVEIYWQTLQSTRKQITGAMLETAKNKHSASQSKRRRGSTKLDETQKRQVRRAYDAAFSKYGTIKSLAREYNVSEDTISRAINASDTKQD